MDEWEETGGGGDAIFLHDDGAVVQRSAGTEDGRQQIVGEAGIERDAAFDVGAQSDLALDDDERAGLVLGKKIGGEDDVVVGIAIGGGAVEESQAAAEVGENVANLRLEDDDQREDEVGKHVAHHPVQRGEFADAGEIEDDAHHDQAGQHGRGAGAADHDEDLVDEQSDQQRYRAPSIRLAATM